MRAARINHKQPIGRLVYPDPILLLPLRIHPQRVIAGKADLENGGRLLNRARQKEPQKHQEASGQETGDAGPDDPAPHFVYLRVRRALDDRARRFSGRCFGGSLRRRSWRGSQLLLLGCNFGG